MGAYNTVETVTPCKLCGQPILVSVQFKYGLRFQFRYKIGDPIQFQDSGKPIPEAAVVVDGAACCTCPMCGNRAELDFYVFFEHGTIVSVEVADGRYSFLESEEPFIVLRP
jgi:hypothetical protein